MDVGLWFSLRSVQHLWEPSLPLVVIAGRLLQSMLHKTQPSPTVLKPSETSGAAAAAAPAATAAPAAAARPEPVPPPPQPKAASDGPFGPLSGGELTPAAAGR